MNIHDSLSGTDTGIVRSHRTASMQHEAGRHSSHYYDLDSIAKQRYREKMEKVGVSEDLYLVYEWGPAVNVDWQEWPCVKYPDVFNFLTETPSLYTGESLKAYISFEAYNFYINGWVENICVFPIPRSSGTYFVIGRVKHSQRLSASPAKPWVAVKMEGTIVCAHCTCMAGLGEACSHIAALLFTVEGNTQHQKSMTCTSLPCSWLPPSFKNVSYSQLADIDFTTPQQKMRKSECSDGLAKGACSKADIPEPSANELDALYKDLSHATKPVLLSLIPGYSDCYVPLCSKGILPKPLSLLFSKEYLDYTYPNLLQKCEEVFNTYTITSEVAKNIEKETRQQTQSKIWFQQRAGRITASRLKAAVCTDHTQPSQSLIKAVCYPESARFKSKAQHGGVSMKIEHDVSMNVKFRRNTLTFPFPEVGWSNVSYPFMGASPDGIIKCECCGYGVNVPILVVTRQFLKEQMTTFCLKDINGELSLDVYHAYYFQIQAQMKFYHVRYCDFVVWREGELVIQWLRTIYLYCLNFGQVELKGASNNKHILCYR